MTLRLSRRGLGQPLQAFPGTGLFTGYASLFGKRDGSGDIVMPGAFIDSLRKRGVENIRMLFQHSPSEPVGTWLDIHEDECGLFVRGRLDKNVQRGRELFSLLENGGLDGLSIGFKTVAAKQDRFTKSRHLMSVDLWEISLVTFPMLEGARVSAVKSRAEKLFSALINPVAERPPQSFGQLPQQS
jgi:HK97 family phage prohead protease